jgi:HEAT repeat protein
LQVEAAVTKLKELTGNENRMIAIAAIDALRKLGAISELDAAIEKLGKRTLTPAEMEALAKARDPRSIAKLKEMLETTTGNYLAARLLAEMGEEAAFLPLVRMLGERSRISDEVARALGKLGDPRAIEPLKRALARASVYSRAGILEGLLMLEAPGTLDQILAEVRSESPGSQATGLLLLLGRQLGNDAVAVVEPFLGHATLHRTAARVLWGIQTPEATSALKTRLLDTEYAYSDAVLTYLVNRDASTARQSGVAEWKEQVRRISTLLREVEGSPNSTTATVARQQLKLIEQAAEVELPWAEP